MAKNKGWWTLTLEGNTGDELSECDRDHIAKLIKEGFTSGDIVKDD